MDDSELIKNRMNLAAIRKVDPYAKCIVDSSSHVAFYTFNSNQNEWEKTDVEGVFFIYSRNAQPFHSIFINNRLNTTSFVEPITNQLELQTQPPFLLYRNERSRIRGFWFYNSVECSRIGNLVSDLVHDMDSTVKQSKGSGGNDFKDSVNIFKMLSVAQSEYTSSLNSEPTPNPEMPPRNVLNFFAAAKPSAGLQSKKWLPTTMYVEQLEKQHRIITPEGAAIQSHHTKENHTGRAEMAENAAKPVVVGSFKSLEGGQIAFSKTPPMLTGSWEKDDLLDLITSNKQLQGSLDPAQTSRSAYANIIADDCRTAPLSKTQFIEAFTHLLRTDDEFVYKLHNTYLNILSSKMVIS